ncbi:phosphatase 2C [Thraustotheca clavata]|uniref:Phosphatase 2C n=1 Tax=Thraustotheca clavata TaxID=74557 RepID=A0A1V9ZQ07_9STRA|nr:phosphatase 2C [Thraustotheca clavata]
MSAAECVFTQKDVLLVITSFQFGVPETIGELLHHYQNELKHKKFHFHHDIAHLTKHHRRFRGYVACRLIEEQRVNAATRFLQYFKDPNSIKVPRTEAKFIYTMDNAVRARSLPLLMLLHNRNFGECTASAIDIAASNGDFPIVEFLHTHRREGCTSKGFSMAKRNGHLDIVAYLHDNRYDQDRIEYFARKEAESDLNAPFIMAMSSLLLFAFTTGTYGQSWPPTNQCSANGYSTWDKQCPSLTASNVQTVVTQPQSGALKSTNLSSLDTLDQARAVLQGQSAVQAMSGLRSQSTSWYNASLTNMMIAFCQLTSTSADLTRCVTNTSIHAARDRNNLCIVSPGNGSCVVSGLCERQANCMWPTPISGKPRSPRYTQDQIDSALSWVQTSYAESLVPYAAPGITLAVLSFFSFLLFFIMRCFCNRCGGRNPVERGYTWCSVLIPGVTFFLISFAIFICCIAAYVQNNNVTSSMHILFTQLAETLNDAQIFANNLLSPLQALQASQASTVSAFQSSLNNTSWIVKGAATLQSMGAAIDSTYTNAFPKVCVGSSSQYCLSCPTALCGTATTQPQALAAKIATTAQQLDTTFQVARTTIYSGSNTLFQAVNEAEFEVRVLSSATNNSNKAVSTVESSFDDISYSRTGLVLSIFVIGLVVSLLGMIGFLRGVCKDKSKFVHLLHISWILGVILCIISFVVASLLMAVSALWFDGCKYLDMIVNNMSPYFSAETSELLTSCIQGTSTLVALEMSSAYQISCGLYERLSIAQSIDANSFTQQLQALSLMVYGLSDFGYSTATQNTLVQTSLKNLPTGWKSTNNVADFETPWILYSGNQSANCTSDPDPAACYIDTVQKCAKDSVCYTAFQDARTYAKTAKSIQNTLWMMHQDFQGNTNYNNSANWPSDSQSMLQASLAYSNQLSSFLTSQIPPLTNLNVWKQLNTLQCTSSDGCSWINQEYAIVHNVLCQDLLGTCLNIALCVFLVALFLIPLAICGIILQKRLRGIRGGAYGAMEQPDAVAPEVKLTGKAKLQAKLDALTKGKITTEYGGSPRCVNRRNHPCNYSSSQDVNFPLNNFFIMATMKRKGSIVQDPSLSRLRQQDATATNVASPKGISVKKPTTEENVLLARRRLSVVSDNTLVEGLANVTTADHEGIQDGESSIGCYAGVTKKGYAPYNPRKKNQDSMIMQFDSTTKSLLLGVFDGHGEAGDGVSQFFKSQFPTELFKHPSFATTGDPAKDSEGIKAAITFAMNTVEKRVLKDSTIDTEFSGSTGVVGVIRDKLLVVGNVGDSRITRGFMQGNTLIAEAVSDDHKPDRPLEKARILAAGGRVFAVEYDDGIDGPPRVWLGHMDVPGLAMSRSLGDAVAHTAGVSSEPEFFSRTLDANDKYLVIATDGLWEFMSDDEVIKMASAHTDPKQAVDVLILEANRRWMKEEQVIDDTTVIVAFVNVK